MTLLHKHTFTSVLSCSRQKSVGPLLLPTRSFRATRWPCTGASAVKSYGWIESASRRRQTAARVAADGQATAQLDVTVEEVMNPHPVLLEEDMNIKDAVHKLLDANVSGAPVINSAGQLKGVLTEADVIWKGAGRPEDHYIIPPVFIGFADAFLYLRDNKKFDEEVHKILARTVAEAMAKENLIQVAPSTPMSEAAHLMLHHDVNLLPVVESDGKVVGVVTRHDILRGIYASKSPFLG